MSDSPNGLVKRAIRITALRNGQPVMTQLFQHTPIRIGRLLDNDFVLPFDFISRHHFEIRFDGEAWRAHDLGSKNGLLLNDLNVLREINLQEHREFRVQEISFMVDPDILIEPEVSEGTGTFSAMRDAATVIAPLDESVAQLSSVTGPSDAVLNVDLNEMIFAPHPMIHQGNQRAIQLTVMWHDQILDMCEFDVGTRILWEWQGVINDLGVAKNEKTKIAIPRGCKPSAAFGNEGDKHLTVTLTQPAAFQIREDLFVFIRFVPRGIRLTSQGSFVDRQLVDPLLASAAAHGAIAVAALLAPAPSKHVERQEPDRFAKIIVAPTPVPVAMQPTPTPTPPPTPTPQPKQVAKKPAPTPPPIMVKKVVDMKKRAPVALAKKEVASKEAVEKKTDSIKKTPPPPKPEKLMAKVAPAKPAPTPVPFQPKSVGALAMLSALKAGPARQNVEQIQIARTPADSPTQMRARDSVKGTGEIISKLNQSAKGGGRDQGDAEKNVAVGGKASASYQTAGLSNQSGKRAIRGSVVGGATYSELNKTEGLRRSEVMKIVQQHQMEIQQCYEAALLTNPDLSGRAEFEWEISPKGSVTYVKVKESSVAKGDSLLECVKGVFKKMIFPKASNGETTTPTIGLPFGRS